MRFPTLSLACSALLFTCSSYAAPDLIVKDIRLIKNCKILVTVANIGNTGVPSSSYVLPRAVGVQMWKGPQPWGGLILKGVDPTGKLKSRRGYAKHVWFPRAANLNLSLGWHTIKVKIDSNNFLRESNERNNVLVRRLRCHRGLMRPRKRPDLVVTKIGLDKKCRVVIQVKNRGPGLVPLKVWTKHYPKSSSVYFYVNGKRYGGQTIWKFNPSKSLRPANGVATMRSNYVVKGTKVIKATIDHTKQVKETNERNNSKTRRLRCAPRLIRIPRRSLLRKL